MTDRVSNGKVALVTGASSGLGSAIALEAARRRFALALTARRADLLDAIAKQARTLGVEAEVFAEDLADPDAPERLALAVRERFERLDVLVNNAGMGVFDLFDDADPDALRRQIQVNFAAPLLLTRFLSPPLVANRGVIVNIGSAIIRVANPGLGAYGATKAGLTYWNDAARRDMKRKNVSVCLVELGPTRTDFFERRKRPKSSYYNPFLDRPLDFLQTSVDRVARRVVDLFDRPRRRIGPPFWTVVPVRWTGTLIDVCPWLGDFVLDQMLRWQDRYNRRGKTTMWKRLVDILEMIKFSHTLFAMPFALLGGGSRRETRTVGAVAHKTGWGSCSAWQRRGRRRWRSTAWSIEPSTPPTCEPRAATCPPDGFRLFRSRVSRSFPA